VPIWQRAPSNTHPGWRFTLPVRKYIDFSDTSYEAIQASAFKLYKALDDWYKTSYVYEDWKNQLDDGWLETILDDIHACAYVYVVSENDVLVKEYDYTVNEFYDWADANRVIIGG
jgi:hypothetical protein